jgi:hypothetical protein
MKNTFGTPLLVWTSAAWLLVMATVAFAQAGPPRTLDAFGVFTYVVVAAICAGAGALTNAKAYIEDDKRPHQLVRLWIDIGQAELYGFSTFFAMRWYGYDELATMAAVLGVAYGGTGLMKLILAARKIAGQP